MMSLVLSLFVAFLQTSYALKCVSCTSIANKKCSDPFDKKEAEKLSIDCSQIKNAKDSLGDLINEIAPKNVVPEDKLACTKLSNGKGTAYRECGFKMAGEVWCEQLKKLKMEKDAAFKEEDSKDKFTCVLCEGELCNTGTSFQAVVGLFFSSFALLMNH